jgi:phosphoenolpyruvate carboxykinase (ATP)
MAKPTHPEILYRKHLEILEERSETLSKEELIAMAATQGAEITSLGQVSVWTGDNTGRNTKARFILDNQQDQEPPVDWGEVNKPVSKENFDELKLDILDHLGMQGRTLVGKYSAIAPNYHIPSYGVKLITESASHQLFADNMFWPEQDRVAEDITILHAPSFEADPEKHGTVGKEGVFIDFESKTILIAGTIYAGEIKKAVFTILNREMPKYDVLPLHSSAGVDANGDVSMFFGLSGTGKTTLSATMRKLIGDDEHGWGPEGVVNFEGGCYAKVKDLDHERELDIYLATQQRGTILENVKIDETGQPEFDSPETHANGRSSYPLNHLPGIEKKGHAGHPKNIFLLSFDAHGVLPPLSKLTPEQAVYYFLQGYTSKVAGTELGAEGDSGEPQTTFSACFGKPFLPLHPTVYGEMLKKMIKRHDVNIWMVNTGYVGGPEQDEGDGNRRVALEHTKALVQAAMSGELDDVETIEGIFGLEVPAMVEGVPTEILNPEGQWENGENYQQQVDKLRGLFAQNYDTMFRDTADDSLNTVAQAMMGIT